MRKTFLALAVAAILVAMLAVPAFAGTFDLPLVMDAVNNDQQKGWATTGFEDEGPAATIPLEVLRGMTALVIECPEPAGAGIQFVLQAPGNWWQQGEFQVEDVYKDGKITLTVAEMDDQGKWEFDEDDFRGKLLVCYYDSNIADLGITKAYIIGNFDLGGAPATPGDGKEGPVKTGDNFVIYAALGALVLAAGCTVFMVRKVKAH